MWCCEAAGHVRRRSNGVDGASASDIFAISVALVGLAVRRRPGWGRLSYGIEVEFGREHGSRAGHLLALRRRRVVHARLLHPAFCGGSCSFAGRVELVALRSCGDDAKT